MTIKNDIKTFEHKGVKVHIIYCRHCCGQKPKTNLIWSWCVTEGGCGKSEAEVMEAAKKWIDGMKGK